MNFRISKITSPSLCSLANDRPPSFTPENYVIAPKILERKAYWWNRLHSRSVFQRVTLRTSVFKQSLAVAQQICVQSHVQFSRAFYLNIYFIKRCQEGR